MTNIDSFCNQANFTNGSFPFKSLGILIVDKNLKVVHFSPLLDKIFGWLAGWKSKFLSLGGILQLIHSSINGFLSYLLWAIAIMKGILNKDFALVAKFFFHRNDQNKFPRFPKKKYLFPPLKVKWTSSL